MVADLSWVRLTLGLAGTVVYCLVGIEIGRRRTSREGIPGMRAFQFWWFGLALLTIFTPLTATLDAFTVGDLLTLRIFLLHLVILVLMLAIGGLLYYLLYVYVGKPWVIWPVVAYAFLEAAWILTVISQAHIIGYGPGCPSGGYCYERPVAGSTASTLLSLTFSVPILLATLGYFSLYFRVETPVQRRRVAMVAGALFLWFGAGIVASFIYGNFENADGVVERIALNRSPYWTFVVSPLVSLSAALVIYWAYRLGAPASRPPVPG